MKKRFDRTEIGAAMERLGALVGAGKTMGEVLAGAGNEYDDSALRMAFTLGLELRKRGMPLSAVESVDYERLDKHRHAVEINWAERRRRREARPWARPPGRR